MLNDLKKKKWSFDKSFMNIDTIKILDKSKIIFSESEVNIDSCNMYKVKKEKSLSCNKIRHCRDEKFLWEVKKSKKKLNFFVAQNAMLRFEVEKRFTHRSLV